VKKVVPTDSFFSFFSPPSPPSDDDDEDDLDEDIDEKLELDYQIGEDLKERVSLLPFAPSLPSLFSA
jgi:nucleosome assembly protein 1-like 1